MQNAEIRSRLNFHQKLKLAVAIYKIFRIINFYYRTFLIKSGDKL